MIKPAAFQACYSDWKLVKTRGVVQVVLEVPLAAADAAYEVLGGMPNISAERWFGIAALKSPPAKEEPPADTAKPQPVPDKPQARAKRDWRNLPPSQQAALRCQMPVFEAFLKNEYRDEWHETGDVTDCIRMICNVPSRADLDKPENHAHRMLWHNLDSQFQAWERVGA